MIVMIDNYDSFTYNLVQYFGELGQSVQVFRNDQVSIEDIARRDPEYLVISPGPCTPDEAGISVEAVRHFAGEVPVFGVCLGHQSVGQAFGAVITHAKTIMHGKLSAIYHDNTAIFNGLKNGFAATRYHSLVIKPDTLPQCLEVTAWTDDGEIMAVRHREFAVQGVQFHPESIATAHGHQLLANFLEQA